MPTDVAELTLDSSTSTGVGFDVGLLASPTENLSIGVSYRHKVTIDHAAQAGFAQILTGTNAVDDAVAVALPAIAGGHGDASPTRPASRPASRSAAGYWTFEGRRPVDAAGRPSTR